MAVDRAALDEAYRRGLLKGDRKLAYEALKRREQVKSESAPDPQEAPSGDYKFGKSANNFLPDLADLGREMYHGATHPKDVFDAYRDAASGAFIKTINMLPGAGYEHPSTKAHDTLVDGVSENYGTPSQWMDGDFSNIKRYAENKPAHALFDVSGVAGATTQLPKLTKFANIPGKLDPTHVVPKLLSPKFLPRRLYGSAVKAFGQGDLKTKMKRIDTAVTEGIRPTPGGVDKLYKLIDQDVKKVNAIYEKHSADGVLLNKDAYFRDLEALKGSLKNKVGGTKRAAQLDEFIKTAKEQDLPEHQYTPTEAAATKRDLYGQVEYDPGKPERIEDIARKKIARNIRTELDTISPEAAKINKRLGGLYELRKPLEQRAKVIHGNNPISIDAPIKAGAMAAAGGGVPATASAFALGMVGPRAKAELAIFLERVRKQVNSGALSADQGASMIRQMLGQGGRLEQSSSDQNQ